MEKNNQSIEEKNVRQLPVAIIDDFRGFIVDGERVEVSEDKYHIQIALEKMKEVAGWEYVSGTGQNPLIDYLRIKQAIYITKIRNDDVKESYQRTVGYLKSAHAETIDYKGKKKPAYQVIREIAIGLGYDVDEYEINPETNKIALATYKGSRKIKKTTGMIANRRVSEGDKPVFGSNNQVIGFMHAGKFCSIEKYKRYGKRAQSSKKKTTGEKQNPNNGVGR